MTDNNHEGPLLSLRTAVVLVAASHVGAWLGGIAYLGAQNSAAAAITALTTFGATALGLHKVIGS